MGQIEAVEGSLRGVSSKLDDCQLRSEGQMGIDPGEGAEIEEDLDDEKLFIYLLYSV